MTDSSCSLHERQCRPWQAGTPPLAGKELQEYFQCLGGGWKAVEARHIEKDFGFWSFREALAFTIRVGQLAESVVHRPTIDLVWGKVRILLGMHMINGLAEADLVLAARVDKSLDAGR